MASPCRRRAVSSSVMACRGLRLWPRRTTSCRAPGSSSAICGHRPSATISSRVGVVTALVVPVSGAASREPAMEKRVSFPCMKHLWWRFSSPFEAICSDLCAGCK
ncbi:MAG: hypothetical protein ACK56F_27355, partial [bacterium]